MLTMCAELSTAALKSGARKAWAGHAKPLQYPHMFNFKGLSSLLFNVYEKLRNLKGRLIMFRNSTELGDEKKFNEYQVLKYLKRLDRWTRCKNVIEIVRSAH